MKTLYEHANDGSFRPVRHAELLATDDSLLPYLLGPDDEDPDGFFQRLAHLCLDYRAARSPLQRREVARAFAALADRGNWKPSTAITFDRSGAEFVWAWENWGENAGKWALTRCACAECRRRWPPDADFDEILAVVATPGYAPSDELLSATEAAMDAEGIA